MKPAAPARQQSFVDYKARDGKGRIVRGVITLYDLAPPEALNQAKEKIESMGYDVLKVRRLNRLQIWWRTRRPHGPRVD